jgi:hypothetical protein
MRYVLHTWTELPFFDCSKGTERNKIPEKCFEKNENKKKEFQTENKRVKIQIESRNKHGIIKYF